MNKFEIGVGQAFPLEEGRKGRRHHRHGHHHPHRGRHGGHRKLLALLLMAMGHCRGNQAAGRPERNAR